MSFCIVCMGSNHRREENLRLAQRKLKELFSPIRFSSELETEPLNMTHSGRFTNQVALFETTLSPTAIRSRLKEIERQSGRLPEEKRKEIIRLDIDLLTYDGQVLRPDDWKREYVIELVNQLIDK